MTTITFSRFLGIHHLRATVLALLAMFCSVPAHAVPLSYSFTGIAGTDIAGPFSFLDLGGGPVNVSGSPFTITGMTSDVDESIVVDGVGLFPATSTYDFGAFGAFTTDAGADRYFQNCLSLTEITCAGLTDELTAVGFILSFGAVAGDPNFGIPLGTPVFSLFTAATRAFANRAGDTLTLDYGSFSSLTVSAKSLPGPGTLGLLSLGLVGLARRRRAVH